MTLAHWFADGSADGERLIRIHNKKHLFQRNLFKSYLREAPTSMDIKTFEIVGLASKGFWNLNAEDETRLDKCIRNKEGEGNVAIS